MAKLIGNLPSQVPTNGDLGTMAYQDYDVVAPQFLAGRRNLIINGAMQVAQRGTSVASAGYFYNLDRWESYGYSGASTTVSQQAFTVGQTDVPNAKYFARIASTNNQCYIQTKIEDVHTAENSTVTLSFYAKSSDISTLRATMYQSFGSGGSGQVTTSSQSNLITSSWQKFVLNFSLPSISGKTVGTGSYVGLWFDTSGTTGTVDIAQVQLEVGSVATPFEHRSYGEELALCQRYLCSNFPSTVPFQDAWDAAGVHAGTAGWVAYSTAAARSQFFYFPVEMRANPTITLYSADPDEANGKWGIFDTGATGWNDCGSNSSNVTTTHLFVRENSSPFTLTVGNSYLLRGMWSADAEL